MTTRMHAAASPLHLAPEAVKGFGTSTAVLALLLLVYLAAQPQLDIVRVRLALVHPVETFMVHTALPPTQHQRGRSGGGHDGATARADVASTQPPQTMKMIIPVPTDDLGLGEDPFDPNDLGVSNGTGGGPDGVSQSRFGTVDGDGRADGLPSNDEILEFVEIDPQIDLEALRDAIVYPEMARRNGIEGTVIVRALVTADGAVSRVEVYHSDNALLDQAALSGVQHATFTPGKQNGHAVSCWIYVPGKFALSH